jgi:ATP-dependent DNA ligase
VPTQRATYPLRIDSDNLCRRNRETAGGANSGLACDNDLEGIVAKRKFDPYIENQAKWLKIRNTACLQWVGREELFDRERESDPDLSLWDDCVRACSI